MKSTDRNDIKNIQSYYEGRASSYDQEANWVHKDLKLIHLHYKFLKPKSQDKILDVATGTGIIGEAFYKNHHLTVGPSKLTYRYISLSTRYLNLSGVRRFPFVVIENLTGTLFASLFAKLINSCFLQVKTSPL